MRFIPINRETPISDGEFPSVWVRMRHTCKEFAFYAGRKIFVNRDARGSTGEESRKG